MSEGIHAFGEDGALSQGAEIALAAQAAQIIESVNSRIAVVAPVFTHQDAAVAYEADNPGRIGLWFDTGYVPPTIYTDDFNTPAADLYSTSVDGLAWEKALGATYGVSEASMAALVTGGYAARDGVNGAGAVIDTGSGSDFDVTVVYDLTAGAGIREVRAVARGNPSYLSPGGRIEMPVMAVLRSDGSVRFEPHQDPPGTFVQLELGTGAPQTGTLRLSVIGNQAQVYVNDSQVGAAQTLTGDQLTGTKAGFGVYLDAHVSSCTISVT